MTPLNLPTSHCALQYDQRPIALLRPLIILGMHFGKEANDEGHVGSGNLPVAFGNVSMLRTTHTKVIFL